MVELAKKHVQHDQFILPALIEVRDAQILRAAASIAGLQTGLAIHIVLVGVGLGTLFSRSVLAFEVLKWAGAAYLIWLGIQQWRAAGAPRTHAG